MYEGFKWQTKSLLVKLIDIEVSRLAIGFQKVCILRLLQCTSISMVKLLTYLNMKEKISTVFLFT